MKSGVFNAQAFVQKPFPSFLEKKEIVLGFDANYSYRLQDEGVFCLNLIIIESARVVKVFHLHTLGNQASFSFAGVWVEKQIKSAEVV